MSQLKGLTIQQPWASRIAWLEKQYETRGWSTSYRGLLVIHAGKEKRYIPPGTGRFPLGAIIAVARIEDVLATDSLRHEVSELELALGDWRPGRYAWRLGDVNMLREPIPFSGRQGLWNVPPATIQQIRATGLR